jgi:hypothetical protein
MISVMASTPVAADLAVAVVFGVVRTGLRIGATVTGGLRPVLDPVLRPERWPRRLQDLAESGYEQRQLAVAEAIRLYRTVAPKLVTDVLDQLDLTTIVRGVLDDIDLPGIIRASTGSVAGESVRDARIQVMAADDAVAERFARFFRRQQPPRPVTPHDG